MRRPAIRESRNCRRRSIRFRHSSTLHRSTMQQPSSTMPPLDSRRPMVRRLPAARALLPEGLPRRPWYQHSLYAPGFYTGYGVKTMPGAREAMEQKNWVEADAEIVKIAAALEREAELITKAAALMEKKVVP